MLRRKPLYFPDEKDEKMRVYRASYLWDGHQLHRDAFLYVKDGLITSPAEGEVVDLGRRLIMPGFVNSHTHVAMVLMRGLGDGLPLQSWLRRMWEVEEKLDEKALEKASLYGLAEMASSGITAFMDFYNVPPMVRALKRIKLRAVLTLAFMDKVEYMKEESWKRVRTVDRYLRMTKEVGAALAIGPHAPYTCTIEMLNEIGKLSKKYRLKIHTHLAETMNEALRIRRECGERPLGLLKKAGLVNERLVIAHGIYLTAEEMRELGKARTTVVHCPRSNSRLGSGIAKVGELAGHGVNVALGTDGPASSEDFDMFEEMRLALYLRRAKERRSISMPVLEALKMATENGARALNLDSGLLKEGRPADFIVLNLDKVRFSWDVLTSAFYSLGREDVEEVYVGGEKVYHKGEVMGIDMEGLAKEMEEIRRQLE